MMDKLLKCPYSLICDFSTNSVDELAQHLIDRNTPIESLAMTIARMIAEEVIRKNPNIKHD